MMATVCDSSRPFLEYCPAAHEQQKVAQDLHLKKHYEKRHFLVAPTL